MEYLSDYSKGKIKELVLLVEAFLDENFKDKSFDFDFVFADDTAARLIAFTLKKALQKRAVFVPIIYLASSGSYFDAKNLMVDLDKDRSDYLNSLLKYFRIPNNSKALIVTDIIKSGANLEKLRFLLDKRSIVYEILAVNDRTGKTADYNLDNLSLANFLYSSTELRGVKRHSGIPPRPAFDLAFAMSARKFIIKYYRL